MGLAARRAPGAAKLPLLHSPKKEKRKKFLTAVDSVFLSGAASFLSKVLTDTQGLSQARSPPPLLRNGSGQRGGGGDSQGGGGGMRKGPFPTRNQSPPYLTEWEWGRYPT